MFEVRNQHNQVVRTNGKPHSYQSLDMAKLSANDLYMLTGEHFNIFNVEQVWTTQTLDEAMKPDAGSIYELVREMPPA